MTVADFIKQLQQFPQNARIVGTNFDDWYQDLIIEYRDELVNVWEDELDGGYIILTEEQSKTEANQELLEDCPLLDENIEVVYITF